MKKTAITAAVLAASISLSVGTVYAAGQIARGSAIGEETARNFAYIDAGILPENAECIRTEFDYEHGSFVYEIEFTAEGTHYEYTMDSSSGEILERESKAVPSPEPDAPAPVSGQFPTEGIEGNTDPSAASLIRADDAKRIALKQAGLSEEEVVFSKAKLERENGRQIYDIEFYIAGVAEYDYEIDAETGDILEESIEKRDKEAVASNGGKHDGNDPKKSGNSATSSGTDYYDEQGGMISVDEAKTIALTWAGLSAEDVVFRKAKLEHDDGKRIYDIEFYVNGKTECEYEIDAYSGTILDEEIEPLDSED